MWVCERLGVCRVWSAGAGGRGRDLFRPPTKRTSAVPASSTIGTIYYLIHVPVRTKQVAQSRPRDSSRSKHFDTMHQYDMTSLGRLKEEKEKKGKKKHAWTYSWRNLSLSCLQVSGTHYTSYTTQVGLLYIQYLAGSPPPPRHSMSTLDLFR